MKCDLRVRYNGFSTERDKVADNIVGQKSDGGGCFPETGERDLQYIVNPLRAQASVPKLIKAGYTCEIRDYTDSNDGKPNG